MSSYDIPMSAIERALLAVMAADGGDMVTAHGHISRAQEQTRTTDRRERQVVEIASLVVAGDRARAAGLALEHRVEFPRDAELLAHVAPLDPRIPVSGDSPRESRAQDDHTRSDRSGCVAGTVEALDFSRLADQGADQGLRRARRAEETTTLGGVTDKEAS